MLEDIQPHNFTGDLFHIKYFEHILYTDKLKAAVKEYTGVDPTSQNLQEINKTICDLTKVGIMQKAMIDTLQKDNVEYLKKTLFFKMKCNAYFMGKDEVTGDDKYSIFFYYDHDKTLVTGLHSSSEEDCIQT